MKQKRGLFPVSFFNSRLTAAISISLVLFLLGLIILLSLFAKSLSGYVWENLSFDVVLSENMKVEQITQLRKRLETSDFAKSVEYISKEDAAKQLENELGKSPEEFLGFNPLPSLLVVHMNADYAHIDSISVIEKQIKGLSADIKGIEYQEELISLINENLAKAGVILFSIALLLLFISFALINNTIRLMVYSKRFLIHTMKLVGATNGFIRTPFIKSNISLGIIAAFVASGLLIWLLFYFIKDISKISEIICWQSLIVVFGAVLVLGIIISWIATYFAVNKYLHMKGDDLYYL
jgi:Cell division protein